MPGRCSGMPGIIFPSWRSTGYKSTQTFTGQPQGAGQILRGLGWEGCVFKALASKRRCSPDLCPAWTLFLLASFLFPGPSLCPNILQKKWEINTPHSLNLRKRDASFGYLWDSGCLQNPMAATAFKGSSNEIFTRTANKYPNGLTSWRGQVEDGGGSWRQVTWATGPASEGLCSFLRSDYYWPLSAEKTPSPLVHLLYKTPTS